MESLNKVREGHSRFIPVIDKLLCAMLAVFQEDLLRKKEDLPVSLAQTFAATLSMYFHAFPPELEARQRQIVNLIDKITSYPGHYNMTPTVTNYYYKRKRILDWTKEDTRRRVKSNG